MLAPTPPQERFFGHARILSRDPLRTLVRWMEDYGPVVRFRVGRREAHVVFGPEAIRRVLSDPDGIYGKETHGYRTLRLFVGDGLLTSEGEKWTSRRRLLQPAFHRQTLARHIAVMTGVAERWAERLAASSSPVRIDEIAMRATLEIVSTALLGSDLIGSAGEVADAITDLQVCANRRISAAITLPFAIPTPEHIKIRRARTKLRRILRQVVQERRAAKKKDAGESDVVGLLLDARDADTGEAIPIEDILDELVTLLIAGHESTANALSWAFVLLSTHRAELALLQAELGGAAGDPLTLDTLGKLPRLRAVIDETLRLYPPAWSFGRAPRRDDEVAGFSVPAGRLVMLVPWATHRDPALFVHPEAFMPSRFVDCTPKPFSYLPFGGGPRTCIGHAFARVEAQVLLGTWLQKLDFELVSGQDLEPLPLITLRPRAGVLVRVARRGH